MSELDDARERARVPVRVRLAHARQHREHRGHLGRVRRDVTLRPAARSARRRCALLLEEAAKVGRAHQLEAPAEARKLGVLAERVEVQLVGAAHHHAVELHVLLRERDLARLDRELQVLEGVERALQEIAELEQPAGRFDELAVRLEERDRLERRRAAPRASDRP